MKERDHFGDLDEDGSTILKWNGIIKISARTSTGAF
jgi:hypothetical protein